jgi:hypothetical protein
LRFVRAANVSFGSSADNSPVDGERPLRSWKQTFAESRRIFGCVRAVGLVRCSIAWVPIGYGAGLREPAKLPRSAGTALDS